MTDGWKKRFRDARMPYQNWMPFPKDAIVQVRSAFFPDVPDSIGPASSFFWGYEQEFGDIGEGVICSARRLDKPRATSAQEWGK